MGSASRSRHACFRASRRRGGAADVPQRCSAGSARSATADRGVRRHWSPRERIGAWRLGRARMPSPRASRNLGAARGPAASAGASRRPPARHAQPLRPAHSALAPPTTDWRRRGVVGGWGGPRVPEVPNRRRTASPPFPSALRMGTPPDVRRTRHSRGGVARTRRPRVTPRGGTRPSAPRAASGPGGPRPTTATAGGRPASPGGRAAASAHRTGGARPPAPPRPARRAAPR